MLRRLISIILILTSSLAAGFFYFDYQVTYGKSHNQKNFVLIVEKGEGVKDIALKLEEAKVIDSKISLYYYLKKENLYNKVLPGEYSFYPGITVPEVAMIMTNQKDIDVKITFPEGWDSKKMADRLEENGFDGKGFLNLVRNPGSLINEYAFLKDNNVDNLEGYLFPDTYFFKKETEPKDIIKKMLSTFETKVWEKKSGDIEKTGRTLPEIITMASVVEKEVDTDEDRRLVSGLFWNRIAIGQPLQSCATVAFALSKNKDQFSFEDTRVESPYNTYINKGLPAGPISNPGISSIEAAIYPEDSNYNYFLSDPETGKTIFSSTLEEHNANKVKYGL